MIWNKSSNVSAAAWSGLLARTVGVTGLDTRPEMTFFRGSLGGCFGDSWEVRGWGAGSLGVTGMIRGVGSGAGEATGRGGLLLDRRALSG